LEKTVRLVGKDFAVLTGNGTVLHEALCAGADGAILAVGCAVAELCLEILRASRAGENERAAALQEKLTPLAEAVTTRYGIGGLKAALDLIGYKGGAVRAPLRAPSEQARNEIDALLNEARCYSSLRTGL
jgi:4-hydroxy-2-oxoglutarate aldolase